MSTFPQSNTHNDAVDKVHALLELAEELRRKRLDISRALVLTEDALHISQETQYHDGIVIATRVRSYLLLQSGHFEKAIRSALETIRLANRVKSLEIEKAQALKLIGITLMRIGDYSSALDRLYEALQIAIARDDTHLQYQLRTQVALVFVSTDHAEQALEHLQYCFEYCESRDRQRDKSLVLNYIGKAYAQLGNYDVAQTYYHRAIEIGKLSGFTNLEARLNRIDTLIELEEYSIATHELDNLHEELRNAPETNYLLIDVIQAFAKLYYRQKMWNETLNWAHDLLEMGRNQHTTIHRKEAHYLLSEAYAALDDYQRAYTHHRHYHELAERYYDEFSDIRLKTLQTLFELDTAKKDADFYRKKAQHTQLQVVRDFLSNLTHDLMTPISTIYTSIYLQKRVSDPDKLYEIQSRVELQLQYMKRRIEDINLMVDLQTGLSDIGTWTYASISALIESAIHDQRLQGLSQKIELALSDENIQVITSRRLLYHAFINLFAFALYRLDEHNTLEISDEVFDEAYHLKLCFAFEISDEEFRQLFEPFNRVDKHRPIDNESGLELPIAQQIFIAHGGTIHATSQDGFIVFTIELPANRFN